MPAIPWKNAPSAHHFAGLLLCRESRLEQIEQLAQRSVRSQQVEDGLYWVVLNLPNQTSRTLYMGSSEVNASLIESTARGAVVHALEYAYAFHPSKQEASLLGTPLEAPSKPKLGCTH